MSIFFPLYPAGHFKVNPEVSGHFQTTLAGPQFPHLDVMGSNVLTIPIPKVGALIREYLGIVGQTLAGQLVIVDQPDLLPYALGEPDAHGVVYPEIPIGVHLGIR